MGRISLDSSDVVDERLVVLGVEAICMMLKMRSHVSGPSVEEKAKNSQDDYVQGEIRRMVSNPTGSKSITLLVLEVYIPSLSVATSGIWVSTRNY